MTKSLRRQHSGEGKARAVLESLEGKGTIKETTSALAGCEKTILACWISSSARVGQETGTPAGLLSETGGTGETDEGSRSGVRGSWNLELRTWDRACRARRARRALERLADFFSIQLP
jgi:transposase-like protein